MRHWCITDIAAAPLPLAAEWLEGIQAPANYKDPEKIAAYIAEKKAEALANAALDPDLGRITGIGLWFDAEETPQIHLCETEADERRVLEMFSALPMQTLIGFNSLKYDWPYLMRRADYLGIPLEINLDRFRTPHVDLSELLTHRGVLRTRSLSFYVKRNGWTDLIKPVSGAEEARVLETGNWDALKAALYHDVTATYRLAKWKRVIRTQDEAEDDAA